MNAVTLNKDPDRAWRGAFGADGFSLVELLIAMAVGAIAMLAIYSVFVSVTRSYTIQRDLAEMQQNLRAAMYLIKDDLRNSGRNGKMTGRAEGDNGPRNPPPGVDLTRNELGIAAIGYYSPDPDDPTGYMGITLSGCVDTGDPPEGVAELDDNATRVISYRVMDLNNDGRRELRRWDNQSPTPNWDLVFDGVEDISFAFAYDDDNDLALDRRGQSGANPTIVWGTHTDDAAGLDTNADNNFDGDIDQRDAGDDDLINTTDGNLNTQIPLDRIRAVRIWLLARSRNAYPGYRDTADYVLGHKVLRMGAPANDNRNGFRHKLLTGAVALPNIKRAYSN